MAKAHWPKASIGASSSIIFARAGARLTQCADISVNQAALRRAVARRASGRFAASDSTWWMSGVGREFQFAVFECSRWTSDACDSWLQSTQQVVNAKF